MTTLLYIMGLVALLGAAQLAVAPIERLWTARRRRVVSEPSAATDRRAGTLTGAGV